ncbi:Sec-independent protein translocase protein TatB [Methylotuvimicrobium buryatense]|uniref:Sec-independent protein translocase protein TatB n=1 Tax=Methylotuvimicrobium buryatense TaxID=95641 RepID=A0A4P9UIN9_METBY|nr:Sec-independent protein translocase protein TatB [Methylotuvimicrobium buryatense]QCW80898.1 twin-arginine translocase subunit TatB [Methylotuvimicrobium buryatense]
MFDVGFWELILIGLVSLLVIGPERLPKAARIAGFWVGKLRNTVASVKAEIKQELQAEEIRQVLKEQSAFDEIQKTLDETKEAAHSIQSSIESASEDQSKSK